ncbi:hypothetical protein Ciccas_011060 [Cichlidogyrus casuarinus]|uniref:Uncharacterized protein n=1 Tax=Cichlidogyrus casuarinus TaxID=1844966 RepID=A0ABD2PSZ9_9PLAT
MLSCPETCPASCVSVGPKETEEGGDGAREFVLVDNPFQWLLPRIGSERDMTRALSIKRRRQRLRSNRLSQQQVESLSVTTSSANSTSPVVSPQELSQPSVFEERAALIALKELSIGWELVNRSELQKQELELRRREFLDRHSLSSITDPRNLPLPLQPADSAILTEEHIRDVSLYFLCHDRKRPLQPTSISTYCLQLNACLNSATLENAGNLKSYTRNRPRDNFF